MAGPSGTLGSLVRDAALAPASAAFFIPATEVSMSVAKVTEITSSSATSFEDAIEQGIKRASKTLDQIQGAWIKEQKVVCDGENITEYRVTMKVTFVLK